MKREKKSMSDSIKEITEKIVAFRDARNWKQFHNPKDMAIAMQPIQIKRLQRSGKNWPMC